MTNEIPMSVEAGVYMQTLEQQVKAQALLITKLQAEIQILKNSLNKPVEEE